MFDAFFVRFDAFLCVFARLRAFLHVCTCFACFSGFSRVCARFCDKALSLTVLHTFCLPGAGVENGSLLALAHTPVRLFKMRKNRGHYSCKSSVGEVDILLVLLSWSHETHDCVLDFAVSFVQGVWVNGLLKICWIFCFASSCCFADALSVLMRLVVWEPFLFKRCGTFFSPPTSPRFLNQDGRTDFHATPGERGSVHLVPW